MPEKERKHLENMIESRSLQKHKGQDCVTILQLP